MLYSCATPETPLLLSESSRVCFIHQGMAESTLWVLKFAAFIVVLSGAALGLNEDDPVNSTCPTWSIYQFQTNTCTCDSNIHNVVFCHNVAGKLEITMLFGYCMTLNKNQTETLVGACPFNFKHSQGWTSFVIPSHPSQLDAAVCEFTNRAGQLCGQCMDGMSPPVYSYYPQCVNCSTSNWAKYLTVSLLPTTVFFLGAVAVPLRAAAPHMNGFILFCQIMTSPPILRQLGETYYAHPYAHTSTGVTENMYISYLSIWNLDFFKMVYSPFCLHPNASTLQVISLDYIIAAYPLALIILTYTLVTLHYHNCRLVVCLWRPFLRCCIHFRRQWNIHNSLVDAFATFLLLSYVKFLSVSFDILAPTYLWDKWGRHVGTVLYYDGSVEYFGTDHLPYAVLAMSVLLVFTLLPILLTCLYPCRCFQKCLNSCHLRSQALHIFMDAFQGCYKDGTNGTRDCRYFAAIYLIARVAVYLSMIYSYTANNCGIICLLVILMLLVSGFHPYKKWFYNQLDMFLLGSLTMIMSSSWLFQIHNTEDVTTIDRVVLTVLSLISLVHSLCLVLHCIWRRSRRVQSATEQIKTCFSRPSYQLFEQSLPRRVVMDEKTALLRRKQTDLTH